MAFFDFFDLDLARALREQLVEAFEVLEEASLNQQTIAQVPRERGVYQLYHAGQLVYVGKAASLRTRLVNHFRKISGRTNIDIADMTFKCLWMSPNWTTLAPEAQLIELYGLQGTASWNGNGFGPNDPGQGRDERNDPPSAFDESYPIRSDWPCTSVNAGNWGVLELLTALKTELPFLLRFERPNADYEGVSVTVPEAGMSASELLRLATQAMPPGWQATRFPSHMILYKRIRPFQYGTVIYPEP